MDLWRNLKSFLFVIIGPNEKGLNRTDLNFEMYGRY